MFRNYFFIVLVLLTMLAVSCVHDPFPPHIVEVPVPADTTTTPQDTTDTSSTARECHPDTVYFTRDILPIFMANCATGCHDESTANDGVILTEYDYIINTADVRAGDPDGSDLYEVITETDPDKRMPEPPAPPLSQDDIDLIRLWIEQGAKNNTCDFDSGGTQPCDPSNVSFNDDVQAIFSTSPYNCATCHSASVASGGVVLTTYTGAKTVVDDGRLLGAIRHESGFTSMPQGGSKMDACDIETIEVWIDEGANDN